MQDSNSRKCKIENAIAYDLGDGVKIPQSANGGCLGNSGIMFEPKHTGVVEDPICADTNPRGFRRVMNKWMLGKILVFYISGKTLPLRG